MYSLQVTFDWKTSNASDRIARLKIKISFIQLSTTLTYSYSITTLSPQRTILLFTVVLFTGVSVFQYLSFSPLNHVVLSIKKVLNLLNINKEKIS